MMATKSPRSIDKRHPAEGVHLDLAERVGLCHLCHDKDVVALSDRRLVARLRVPGVWQGDRRHGIPPPPSPPGGPPAGNPPPVVARADPFVAVLVTTLSPSLKPLVISSALSPRRPIVIALVTTLPSAPTTCTTPLEPDVVIAVLGSSSTLSFSCVVTDTLAVMPGFSVVGGSTTETVTL